MTSNVLAIVVLYEEPSSLSADSDTYTRAHRTQSDTAAEAPNVHGGYTAELGHGSSTTGGQAAVGKPAMSKRIVGGAEVVVGHVLGNPAMVMKGQEKKVRWIFVLVSPCRRSGDVSADDDARRLECRWVR